MRNNQDDIPVGGVPEDEPRPVAVPRAAHTPEPCRRGMRPRPALAGGGAADSPSSVHEPIIYKVQLQVNYSSTTSIISSTISSVPFENIAVTGILLLITNGANGVISKLTAVY